MLETLKIIILLCEINTSRSPAIEVESIQKNCHKFFIECLDKTDYNWWNRPIDSQLNVVNNCILKRK